MNPIQHILIFLVRLYRWTLAPAKTFLFGPLAHCRYTPSCSEYAMEAIQHHGPAGGSWLALKRVCRCHPWGGCGLDPVPPGESQRRIAGVDAGVPGFPVYSQAPLAARAANRQPHRMS